jgi:hypothetical protein
MRRTLLTLVLLLIVTLTWGQSEGGPTSVQSADSFVGLNLGHAALVWLASSSAGYTYLPIHIEYAHLTKRNIGLSVLGMYRYEKDAFGNVVQELGAAVGPSYYAEGLNGLFASMRFGLGFAFGRDLYFRNYSRVDLILQPDFGYFVSLGALRMQVGIGLQSLPYIAENPQRDSGSYLTAWDWNSLGMLAHYYLPVVNLTIGVPF